MQLCRHKTLVCEAKAALRPERHLKALKVGLWHSKEDTLERYAHHVVYVTHVKLEKWTRKSTYELSTIYALQRSRCAVIQ